MKKTLMFLSVALLTALVASCAPAQTRSVGGESTAAAGGFAPATEPAPIPQAAQAQDSISLPRKVAVYVTGGETQSENKILSARITHALVSSGKYNAIERSDAFLDQVAREMITQMSGAVDDSQISALGQQSGADFVCIGEMLEAFGDYQISARIVNVVSVEVVASGLAFGHIETMADFAALSDQVVALLLDEDIATATAAPVLGTTVAEPIGNAALQTPVFWGHAPPPTPSVAITRSAPYVGGQVAARRGTTLKVESRQTPQPVAAVVPGGTYYQANKTQVSSIPYTTTTTTAKTLTNTKQPPEDQDQDRDRDRRAHRQRRDEHTPKPDPGAGDRRIHDRSGNAAHAKPDVGTQSQRPPHRAPDDGQQQRRRPPRD